jgi:hypothetical protein
MRQSQTLRRASATVHVCCAPVLKILHGVWLCSSACWTRRGPDQRTRVLPKGFKHRSRVCWSSGGSGVARELQPLADAFSTAAAADAASRALVDSCSAVLKRVCFAAAALGLLQAHLF